MFVCLNVYMFLKSLAVLSHDLSVIYANTKN